MKKIGIVGLGIMGSGMADNFLKNRYKVFVWNRTKEKTKSFKKKGVIVCKSPQEVTEKADIIFEVTANNQSSRRVWLGKNGILKGADKSKILIASATLSVDWIDELFKKCNKLKFRFFDMPLTGGKKGAEAGTLTLLCGGNKITLDKITPVLKAISSQVLYFGPEGHGMRYKLILNYMQGLHMLGFGQAMKMAKKGKMDLKKVAKGLVNKPGGVVTKVAKEGFFKEPEVGFSIEWITKDIKYAKKFAEGLEVSLLDDVLREYKKAIKRGYKDRDWANINSLK